MVITSRVAYLDASALVKLIAPEPGSTELREYLSGADDVLTCRISVVEVARAVARRDDVVVTGLDVLLRALSYRELDAGLAAVASALRPPHLRTLDAMQLAAALSLGTSVGAFVTYDARLAEAARLHALPVVAPGA